MIKMNNHAKAVSYFTAAHMKSISFKDNLISSEDDEDCGFYLEFVKNKNTKKFIRDLGYGMIINASLMIGNYDEKCWIIKSTCTNYIIGFIIENNFIGKRKRKIAQVVILEKYRHQGIMAIALKLMLLYYKNIELVYEARLNPKLRKLLKIVGIKHIT